MYVVGNLREREGKSAHVTSFLCDGQRRIANRRLRRLDRRGDAYVGKPGFAVMNL
jgi:hypothetical protein